MLRYQQMWIHARHMHGHSYFKAQHLALIHVQTNISICVLALNPKFYSDGLFEQYNIQCPIQLQTASNKRKAEYFGGRYCCAQIFQLCGVDLQVAKAPHGAPIWPSHYDGSISHSHNRAVAIMGIDRAAQTMGVDIEYYNAKNTALIVAKVLNEDEKIFLAQCNFLEFDLLCAIVFSAKESLFKALYPQLGFDFYFDAASIVRLYGSSSQGHFIFKINRMLSSSLNTQSYLRGEYEFDGEYVLTMIFSNACIGIANLNRGFDLNILAHLSDQMDQY